MSFRVFLYYSWLWGACGSFLGWLVSEWAALPRSPDSLARDVLPGLGLGLALALVDAVGSWSPRRILTAGAVAASGALLGAAGGMLEGMLTDALRAGSSAQQWQLVGWAFLGGVACAGPGVGDLLAAAVWQQNISMSSRKIRNGVIGGILGGLLGGSAVLGLRLLWPVLGLPPTEDLWTTKGLEQTVYGGIVGLVAALVQVRLREAWVQVESALGRGDPILVSRAETSLGSAGDVALQPDTEVERIHAYISRGGRDFVLTDTGTAAGTHVNDTRVDGAVVLRSGDLIRIGRNTLLFLRRG
jgi:hypothetical protein